MPCRLASAPYRFAAFLRGGSCSTTAKYQKNSWISSGVLLTSSTKYRHSRFSIQLVDTLPAPTSRPSSVLSTMPTMATLRVLYKHSSSACRLLSDEVNGARSEEHTSEIQSLMRTSYAVFCLTKKN